jgi:hypothetical protein
MHLQKLNHHIQCSSQLSTYLGKSLLLVVEDTNNAYKTTKLNSLDTMQSIISKDHGVMEVVVTV